MRHFRHLIADKFLIKFGTHTDECYGFDSRLEAIYALVFCFGGDKQQQQHNTIMAQQANSLPFSRNRTHFFGESLETIENDF